MKNLLQKAPYQYYHQSIPTKNRFPTGSAPGKGPFHRDGEAVPAPPPSRWKGRKIPPQIAHSYSPWPYGAAAGLLPAASPTASPKRKAANVTQENFHRPHKAGRTDTAAAPPENSVAGQASRTDREDAASPSPAASPVGSTPLPPAQAGGPADTQPDTRPGHTPPSGCSSSPCSRRWAARLASSSRNRAYYSAAAAFFPVSPFSSRPGVVSNSAASFYRFPALGTLWSPSHLVTAWRLIPALGPPLPGTALFSFELPESVLPWAWRSPPRTSIPKESAHVYQLSGNRRLPLGFLPPNLRENSPLTTSRRGITLKADRQGVRFAG